MLNLILILAFTGMIIISAGFAGVTFMQGVQSSLDAEITTQRLLDVATQLQSHMRFLDPQYKGDQYIIALPAGMLGNSPYAYNQVPSFVTSSAHSANGVPFEYCPYAQSNDSQGNYGAITMPSGSTYDMGIYSSSDYAVTTDTNGQYYLVDNHDNTPPSGLPAGNIPNIYGLLVAAAPNQFYPPDCSHVTTDNSGAHVRISGGIVAVINNDDINKMNTPSAMTDFRFYISTAPSGDGSGRDPNDFITLTDALTIIKAMKPASTMLYFDQTGGPNTYVTSENFSYGGRLYLAGYQGTADATQVVVETNGDITLDEYSTLSLSNLTLQIGTAGTNTMTVNGTLEMADTSPILTGNLQVYGGSLKGFTTAMTINGDVTVDADGVITSSGPMNFNNLDNRGFNVVNGRVYGGTTLNLNPASANIVPMIIKAGGDFIAGTGAMTINNTGTSTIAGGMIVDPGGRFMGATNSQYRGYNSAVIINDVSNYGFFVHGEMDLMPITSGSAAVAYRNLPGGGLTDGIVLASGGKLQMTIGGGATLGESGSRPNIGIYDEGGSGLIAAGGSGAIYAASAGKCWQGLNTTNLFSNTSHSAGIAGDITSATTTTFPGGWYQLYNNSAGLSCNQT